MQSSANVFARLTDPPSGPSVVLALPFGSSAPVRSSEIQDYNEWLTFSRSIDEDVANFIRIMNFNESDQSTLKAFFVRMKEKTYGSLEPHQTLRFLYPKDVYTILKATDTYFEDLRNPHCKIETANQRFEEATAPICKLSPCCTALAYGALGLGIGGALSFCAIVALSTTCVMTTPLLVGAAIVTGICGLVGLIAGACDQDIQLETKPITDLGNRYRFNHSTAGDRESKATDAASVHSRPAPRSPAG